MSLALAFGRWDVDRFLSEMEGKQEIEWAAFNALHPLDSAYVIMRGLCGGGKNPGAASGAGTSPEQVLHNFRMHNKAVGGGR
jgi:hypothetical protein